MPILHHLHQLKNCAKHRSIVSTKQLHGHLIKLGLIKFIHLTNTLLSVYEKCNLLEVALQQFDEMPQETMLLPDDFVFASLVKACGSLGTIKQGKQVHGNFLVSPFFDDDVVKSSLVDMYGKCGLPKRRKEESSELFSRVPVKDLFAWTALISGLVQSGDAVDAFGLFVEMRRKGISIIDPLVLSSIVGASANLAMLELGKQDVTQRCCSWTSIIVGAAQHGQAEEAFYLYDKMVLNGIKPNEVTFVGLIYACSHVGLVNRGRQLFKSMVEDYGIHPSLQHYTCLLDLLGRSGYLEEAEAIINSMPFKPDEPTWEALLSACKLCGNAKMAIRFADHLLSLKPEEPSTYILLSNVYASSGLWEHASKARRMLETLEVRKEPGYSYVYFDKESQTFYAGESSHPMKDRIFGLLNELDVEMRRRGYVPDTSWILHNTEHQEKERQLVWHSERLAVAYGLLNSVPGTVIRIVKNLRVCGDCHAVLKLISDIARREIVVRDAKRSPF
ncbi:Pentatricopeptide repeat-containing protein [Hibiscus syriacus]|uniref:Pentatricopeptide repeat-containing protein n=1 Tax=Hibiscus syriacus TaxID=106335 RepID=A0A6A3C4V1_HIBSY|nr:Pentatricopeptide repeat-containing protein [Hibiscus syriacus]